MRYVRICFQIAILYLIYWVGTLIQGLLHTSIPGSIIGMTLLFILLQTKIIKEKWLGDGAQFLLKFLALLFVPATVGIMDYLSFFKGKGFITVAIVLVSTFLVMITSSVVGEKIAARKQQKQGKNIGEGFGA
ncbi:CidA/LrgA family holin-like protein [Bacillus timonensis]|uniref:CidA/LrgA family holin-like protein n=1 Tax=Bacillus timonensis TaxID=1033734 RepID=UPI0002885DEF|nr:CidA/LrgA family holin-like protein [Bacillus timonensis]